MPHDFVNAPVTTTVAESSSGPIRVVGAVKTPLTFRVSRPVTLLEAITRAGGLTPAAGAEILVSRPASLQQRVWVQGLIDGTGPEADLRLSGGEEVRVPEASHVWTVGSVNRSGAIRMGDSAETSVLKILALAEGLAPFAAEQAYIYRRERSGKRKEIPIELSRIMERKVPDVTLLANDVLYIPDYRNRRLSVVALEELLLFGGMATATPLMAFSPSR
jgi:polysaccharide export outer membrane protein